MKNTKLLLVAIAIIGFSSCAPRYTCPAYAVKELKKEVPTEKVEQEQM